MARNLDPFLWTGNAGGTAHCIVIISEEDIGSPIIRQPSISIVMNPASMDKYEPLIKPGGLLVANSTLVRTQSGGMTSRPCICRPTS